MGLGAPHLVTTNPALKMTLSLLGDSESADSTRPPLIPPPWVGGDILLQPGWGGSPGSILGPRNTTVSISRHGPCSHGE